MFQLRGGRELTWDAVWQDQCSWLKLHQSKTNENKQTKTHLSFHSLDPLSRAFQWKKLEHFSAMKAAASGSRQAVCCKKQRFAVIFPSPSTSLSPFCWGGLHNTVRRPCASCQACPAQDQHGQRKLRHQQLALHLFEHTVSDPNTYCHLLETNVQLQLGSTGPLSQISRSSVLQ